MQLLKPHTKKWFAALTSADVWRAALTLDIVRWGRNKRVCSLCGKRPARDYQFTDLQFGKETPVTFRLCRACHASACSRPDRRPLVPMTG